MNHYGLIGQTLKHSFSQHYFAEKFLREEIIDSTYELFELESIDALPSLIQNKKLNGFNVTIPYKVLVIPFLNRLDSSAQLVGAVNVVKITDELVGYNSDFYGFRESLSRWLSPDPVKALVLGSGGASMAIRAVLKELNIEYLLISRSRGDLNYEELNTSGQIENFKLIINCTPLGTSPMVEAMPPLDFALVGKDHYFYDLIYNPARTRFLQEAERRGAKCKNGLEMLELQAEKSWEIWKS